MTEPTTGPTTGPLRFALVGAGEMGRHHARVLATTPGIAFVAVTDIHMPTAQRIAAQTGAVAYSDAAHMFDEKNIDAVCIAVPTSTHLDVVRSAVAHGAHMLIEKPLADSVTAARQILDMAASAPSRLLVSVGHIERFNPAIVSLRKCLANDELGHIYHFDARRWNPAPKRIFDVGIVLDSTVHDLDLVRHLGGVEPTSVFAATSHHQNSKRENMLLATLQLSNGATASLSTNWLSPIKTRELHVIGARGSFIADLIAKTLHRCAPGSSHSTLVSQQSADTEPLRAEIDAFVSAVRGERPLSVTGYDGLRAVELAHALLLSAAEHRTIDLMTAYPQ